MFYYITLLSLLSNFIVSNTFLWISYFRIFITLKYTQQHRLFYTLNGANNLMILSNISTSSFVNIGSFRSLFSLSQINLWFHLLYFRNKQWNKINEYAFPVWIIVLHETTAYFRLATGINFIFSRNEFNAKL